MSRMIFVNLPVKDLGKSVEFFTRLGLTFNQQFTDEKATAMVVSDHAYVMLLTEDFYRTFTTKAVADTQTSTEVMVALSADSREEVDRLTDVALQSGGRPAGAAQDHGYMYGRSFEDLDGHIWELIWMDPSAVGG